MLLSIWSCRANSEAVKPPGDGDRAMIASATQRIRGLLRSIPPDLRFTDLRWSRELLQHFIGDEALIDAAQRIHGSLQNALRVRNDLRKFLQRTSTPEYLRIVEYGIYGAIHGC